MIRSITAVMLLCAAPLASADDDVALQPAVPVAFPAGTLPDQLLVEDLTGDGTADLLVAPLTQPAVVARTALGGLTFAPAVTSPLGAAVGSAWALGDLTGDGLPDLVASLPGASTDVRVLVGAGDGSFALTSTLSLFGTGLVHEAALLDADLDGNLDVAVSHADLLRIAFGDGAGGLWVPGPSPGSGLLTLAGSLDVADLNADGHADLVGVGDLALGYGWSTFGNDGDGIFFATPHAGSPDAEYHGSDVGNLDGGSWPDLVISFLDATLPDPGDLQLAHGNGLTVVGDYPGDVIPDHELYASLRLGDLDGDGLDEAVGTQHAAPGTTLLVRSNDGGVLQPAQSFPQTQVVDELQLRDMDADGRLDLVVSHPQDDAVSILLNVSLATGWNELAGALAGSTGLPQLQGTGDLQAGAIVRLRLTHALPLAPVWLVLGLTQANLPFKGGTLMPAPDIVVPGLATAANGELTLSGVWPAGVPSGFTAWMQEWIADAGGPAGFAASNGVVAKTP